MKFATGIVTLTIALGAAYSIPASAEIVLHGNASGPTARCQGALPVFDTNIRKRPLAVQNESSTNAFVTCSFEFDAANAEGNSAALVDTFFVNRTGTPVDVTCTAVSGFDTGTNEYVAVTATVPVPTPSDPNADDQGNIFWTDADFTNGLGDGLISISCNLPAGIGINDTYVFWFADDLTEPTP